MSLSLLVIVHEGGHFLFARLFKTRVEKFCLFFDPWFTLFKFKPKNSDTEYGIGWLPLGGYVKIAGMIDESMDTEQMQQPMQPWEFRAKPAWQRLLIMIGGVLFNFILALFIYSMILFTWGDEYVPVQKAPLGMEFNETAKAIGFRDGDVLISADGVPFERYGGDMLTSVVDARQVTVRRDGQEVSVYIPENFMERLLTVYVLPHSAIRMLLIVFVPTVLLPLPDCKQVTVLCNWTERTLLISILKKRCYAVRKRIQLLIISH